VIRAALMFAARYNLLVGMTRSQRFTNEPNDQSNLLQASLEFIYVSNNADLADMRTKSSLHDATIAKPAKASKKGKKIK
jgi:hypothetical protein